MTPNEKAKKLVHKYYIDDLLVDDLSYIQAKQCALIAVDEIDKYIQKCTQKEDPYANVSALEYWQKVKQEIEAL